MTSETKIKDFVIENDGSYMFRHFISLLNCYFGIFLEGSKSLYGIKDGMPAYGTVAWAPFITIDEGIALVKEKFKHIDKDTYIPINKTITDRLSESLMVAAIEYAESKMPYQSWDRKDHVNIGVFYTHYNQFIIDHYEEKLKQANDDIRKLQFMVKNKLGPEDMNNDNHIPLL